MDKTPTTRRFWLTGGTLACALTLGVAEPVGADQFAIEEVQVEGGVGLIGNGENEDTLDLTNYQPGFSLLIADEDLQKQMGALNKYLGELDWAKAFRLLTELKDEQLQVMTPAGDDGQHVLVKEQLQRQLLSLPPEGRRAFRLYFDGQAAEQFEKIKNHPLPGSEEQLLQTQALVDRLLASSIGGEAAVLLGDMYFERGMFDQSARSWQLALEQGAITGQDALTLQAKRTLAMKRAGKSADAQALFDSLQARYGPAKIQAGGEEVDALALLGQTLDQSAPAQEELAAAGSRQLLPARGAMPVWHHQFLGPKSRNAVNQMRGQQSYYSPPSDLAKFIPPVVADDQRVYFHWLGVVFAIDREGCRLAWQQGSIKQTTKGLQSRVQTNQGDPCNYRIALSDDTLLVTTTRDSNHDSPFVLKAYDTGNGQLRWSSDTQEGWPLSDGVEEVVKANAEAVTELLGQVLVAEGRAYAVVYRSSQNQLFLRRFDPSNGKVDWTIPLGSAEVMPFQYTQVNRMPQPQLMMGQSLLYVMTNNGGLIAVDVIGSEVKWALRMEPPFGIGHRGDQNFFRGNRLSDKLNAMANANGSGRMLLQDGTLYAKEHYSKTLYALDAASGDVKWSADKLKPDAKLIGVDDKRFYLMDRGLQSYEVGGEHDLITKNGSIGVPDHAGAIMLGDHVLLYANRKLRQLDTTQLDPAGRYENTDYLGPKGGHLYVFGDLLVAIDTSQITAFKIPANNQPSGDKP